MFSYVNKGMFKKPETEEKLFVASRPHEVQATPVVSSRPYGAVHHPKILAIGGGKGGIGKSFLSANLALSLVQRNLKVALVDLDFGAANLHTCLGIPNPKLGLFDFVSNKFQNLEDVGTYGGVPGLTLYGGGQEFWQQVRPQASEKIRLITKLQNLAVDFVILDLGAGTHTNTLDFFIFSHTGMLVVVPEPTSIENAYVFLKSVLFRKLQSIAKAIGQEALSEQLLASLNDPKTPLPPYDQLLAFTNKHPELGEKIMNLIKLTNIQIVINQARTASDMDIGTSMTKICNRYFGFNAEFLGVVRYDDAVWMSVRNRKNIYTASPSAGVIEDLHHVSELMIQSQRKVNDKAS